MRTFEDKFATHLDPGLAEASMYFEKKGDVQRTLREITRRLDALGISYVVVGGMALFAHGFRRFTEDVDLLVTPDSMNQILNALEGLGYLQPAGTRSKLRDTQTGVRIEFLLTGGFPGDGKPKAVAFPDPANSFVEIDGLKVLSLHKLVELKLASGISAPHRLKDLADVQELIRVLKLPREFTLQIDASVREKFDELWSAVDQAKEED